MKIDSLELQQLAAAEAPRMDMYAGIHKALRALMADTLLALGRVDVDDEAELARTCHRVVELVEFCASHLTHENEFVHAAMEARAPGTSRAADAEHDEHLDHIARLRTAALALPGVPAPQRRAASQSLYLALSRFIADNLQHMHVEETAHNAVLWAHYTDAELMAIHDALVASIPPGEMMLVARWMLPFVGPAERLGMLLNMRSKVPPPAFAAVLDTIRPHLSASDWSKLAHGLGLEAVPASVSC